jgi:uncharacterized protein YigA (DUF484 family)
MSNQTTQDEQLSPEEFKLRILKQRFAERTAELEELVATLATQNAQLQQENQQLQQQLIPVGTDEGQVEE